MGSASAAESYDKCAQNRSLWKCFATTLNYFYNHHGAEISVIWLVKQSAIKLLILDVTREK